VGINRRFVAEARKRGLGAVQLRVAFHSGRLWIISDMEVEPSPRNRITLLPKRKDRFGNPGAHLHLEVSKRDAATARYAEAVVRDVVSKLELEDVAFIRRLRQQSHHHMGGCRMGEDPKTSVVDRNLRVHGTTNLYVAGAAPFVTCGVAHPTLTIVALALRLADHLKGRSAIGA
jgi:choline dehydrogenase-like flavoprotein